jgi:PTH1 family peptidyl-tRNA hydrolase
MEYRWLITGLGNPGDQYLRTRHNMGFLLADALLALASERRSMRPEKLHDTSEYVLHSVQFAGVPCLVQKPLTYMNLSGRAVAHALGRHGLRPEQVVVVHDELDLELGRVKLKRGGGANGHNGVISVEQSLGSGAFLRLRMGIGRPETPRNMRDFVLEEFSEAELALAGETALRSIKGLEVLIRRGLGQAQQFLHSAPMAEESEPRA